MRVTRNFAAIAIGGFILFLMFSGYAATYRYVDKPFKGWIPQDSVKDSLKSDTTKLRYPLKKSGPENPFSNEKSHALDFNTPDVIQTEMDLDTSLKNYTVRKKIGDIQIGEPEQISVEDYLDQDTKRFQRNYFKERSQAQNFVQGNSIIPEIDLGPTILDKLLSGGFVDIHPQGSAELIFSYDYNRVENPSWNARQQKQGQFKFDQKIQLNVTGTIGDRINLGINYDTEANFEFDNEIKLKYEGKDDDIIKSIEFGNVSLPIPGTLITGAQSLFGIKTQLQFGRLMMTNILSQQRSERKEVTLDGGAQLREYNIPADDYDDNRHFLMAQYFKDHFDESMEKLPVIRSQVQINRVEVWVTNDNQVTENTRNIIGFMDLAEPKPYHDGSFFQGKNGNFPDNDANTLYQQIKNDPLFRSNPSQALSAIPSMKDGVDYAIIDNARKLNENEYTVDKQLGYISLNQTLDDDQALAVAFEYTVNGKTYQVGEFARDVQTEDSVNNPKVLFLKLLKNYTTRTDLPIWDLMMKNVYYLGDFGIDPDDFRFQVIYEDDRSGGDLNFIPEEGQDQLSGKPLVRVLRLDRLNRQEEPQPDGEFDFLAGRTINPQSGRIIFPVLQPFGKYLRSKFNDPNGRLADYYTYESLYDSIQIYAQQDAAHNKFFLRGHYKSSGGSEISLNAINVPEGSVKVTANGIELVEGVDYTVDYTLGKVRIINESLLNSGAVIKVSAESNQLFTIQQKTLIGTRLDYTINKDFLVGGTLLYLREQPVTRKVNIGNEPIANAIWGVDGSYRTDSRFLTRLVDRIPLLDTKEESEVLVSGEFAQVIPGHPKAVGSDGTAYLDDFEGSEIPIDLRVGNYWELASVPEGQDDLIPGADNVGDLTSNFRRAKISWYSIDNLFFRNNSYTPNHIKADKKMQSNHFMREVTQKEVFRNKQIPSGVPQTLNTFDIAYFPSIRGPYNYNWQNLRADGRLNNPKQNWGGLMRKMEPINFEAANIEYIEFWLMDPFNDDMKPDNEGGDMYIDLGNVSEDILKDGLKAFENGMPPDGSLGDQVRKTVWGYAPKSSPINYAFDNNPDARKWQDVGFDGLTDARERTFFDSSFISKVAQKFGENSKAYQQIIGDPAADDYYFFRGDSLDNIKANIIQRYMNYVNPQGNSPTPDQWPSDYSTSGTLKPDVEDINNDFTLNEFESYYQYKVQLRPDKMVVGQNYITDKQTVTVNTKIGKRQITWYQFKIPVRNYQKRVNEIRDFTSIRFMRLFFTDFADSIICRFGQFNLVRGDWRRYQESLAQPGEYIPSDGLDTSLFDISTVNIEENGKRTPIPYVLPPDIQREVNYNTTELLQQNEQSLSLNVCNLQDGDARAAYKNTYKDIRQYEKLKMFVHAEGKDLKEGDLWLFLRIGTDFTSNYYEYAIPLAVTPPQTNDRYLIWPEKNNLDFKLQELIDVKLNRDQSDWSLTVPYTALASDGRGKITIVGKPDLSNIKVMMIGLRNPKKEDNTFPDDGQPVCGEVWVNELRVAGYNEHGGWAAIGRVTTKLADFGKLTLSGNKTTIGFGGIEQSLQERSREDITGVDFQSNFNLGKFFPQNSGVQIPMFYSYSESTSRPEYNPLDRDVKLQTKLDATESKSERNDFLHKVEDFTMRKSLNFTNVQKNRVGGAGGNPKIYDIENFSATYAYTEEYRRNVQIEYNKIKTYRGILNYNYNFPNSTVMPFKKVSRSKYLKLITDFNFNYLPSSYGTRIELYRRYGEMLWRNNTDYEVIVTPNYDKNFTMKRVYDLNWNLTRSIRMSFQATADARIDEPAGPITELARDTIWNNLLRGGRTTRYNHRFDLNYNLPFSKFPLVDWINVRTGYNATYDWIQAPPAADSLGNTIQNSQALQLNTQFNMVNLYNKIEFLRTINQGRSNVERIKRKKLQQMKEEWRAAMAKGEATKEDEPTMDNVSVNESLITTSETIARGLMSLRNVSMNYSRNRGIALPGYMPDPKLLGQDLGENAPGLPFAFGSQEPIKFRAAREGWLTTDTNLNNLYMTNSSENLTAQALIEPVNGFRINLDFNRRMNLNEQEIFRYDAIEDQFREFGKVETGTFSTSFFSLGTTFRTDNKDNTSRTFQELRDNRRIIADRLAKNNIIDTATGFPKGYGPTSQQVLIPSFLAAYTNKDPKAISLDLFPKIPAPNWRINYSGLSNLELLQNFVTNVTLSHGYTSTYTISNFTTPLDPKTDINNLESGENIDPEYLVQGGVSISEQLAPLIGIDITWKNNWTTRLEYRKGRNLNFSFANFQLTEVRNTDFVFGLGYRTKEFVIPFKINGKKMILENDLNFRMDFSIRNSQNIIRRIDEEFPQPVGGSKVLTISPSIDYVINKNLSARIFFERRVTNPIISTSYPRKFTQGGFSIRYTLGG